MKQKQRLFITPAILIALLVSMLATPQAAGAAGIFFTCPSALQNVSGYTCTRTNTDLNVLDRSTGQVVFWSAGTSVSMSYWSVDFGSPPKCGKPGDTAVWRVGWLDRNQGYHFGIVPDVYLSTGAYPDWSVRKFTPAGLTYQSAYVDIGPGTGTCPSSFWDALVYH